MAQVHVVKVDPYDKVTGLLVPVVLQRILDFGRQHYNELDPQAFAREVMTLLMAQDPKVLVVALVEDGTYKVVGHATASLMSDGVNKWIFVTQCKADGNVGDAVKRAIVLADEWGRTLGATKMVMSTPRSDTAWRRKYGFDAMRHLMIREIGAPIGNSEDGDA